MPVIKAHGDVFREWESLLNACQSHQDLMPEVDQFRIPLQDMLAQAREVKSRQEDHEARRQLATQQLSDMVERGREAARRLRGYAKARLGTKSELLIHFGVSPIRRRPRSAPKPEAPAPLSAQAPAQ